MVRLPLFSALVVAGVLLAEISSAQESLIVERRAASRSAPPDARASLDYGVALRRAGMPSEAAAELRRGEALPGGGAGETGIRLRFERARAAIDRRDFFGALTACASIGAIPGGEPASHACAAETQLLRRLATEALLETTKALAGGVRSYEAKVAEGLSHELQGDDPGAEASLRDAIAWKAGAPEARVALGRLLVRVGRAEEGLSELRRAVDIDPRDPDAAYELARALPPGPEAATLLEGAVAERPSFAPALLRLAEIDLDLGRVGPARAAADAASKALPAESAAYVVSGRVALAEGKPDEALRLGQKARALLSNSARAELLVADANAAKGEIELAVEAYQGAYGLDPSDPTPLVSASVACHREGRNTSARAFAARATHDFPGWGPAFVALGDALAGDGEPDKARAAYATALRSSGPVDGAAVRTKLASSASR